MSHSNMKRLAALVLCLCLLIGAAPLTLHTRAASYEPIYFNDEGSEVRSLQARLRDLGYFEGEPTGGYFKVTAESVAAFQEAAGLPVNGRVASSETLALLYSDTPPAPDGSIFQPTPVPTAVPDDLLQYGMRDSDGLRQAQNRLKELGYLHSSVTGNFFDETKNAVEEFQQAVGLPVDGMIISDATLEALFSETAPGMNAEHELVVPTALPTPTPKPAPSTEMADEYDELYFNKTGSKVYAMQARLKELGYFNDEPTGGYYSVTADSVAEFQKAVGVKVDGNHIESNTLAMLFSEGAPSREPAEIKLDGLYFGTSKSAAVRRMQDRLRELGYFSDVSTGGYYRLTAAAVEAFQKAAGLNVDGNFASVEMQQKLYASDAPAAGQTAAPAPTATPVPEATETPAATAEPETTETPETTEAPAATEAPEVPEVTAEPTQKPSYRKLTYAMNDDDDVRALQGKLNELGYLSVAPTGGYWSMTVKAVREFLKDNNMSGSGETATAEMQALLFSKTGPEYGGSDTDYKTLKYGTNGSREIRAMQTRLRALGYFDESSTGNYFSVTQAAVEAFQKAANLPVDGRTATVEMQELLFSAKAPAFGTTLQPEATEKPEENTPGTEAPGDENPEVSYDYDELEYGMRNSSKVTAMQNKLRERGFFSATSTGGYWNETAKAVEAFQKYCGLPVDGKEASCEMLGLLFYTGDLDKLLSEKDEGGDPGEDAPEFDGNAYADAQTNVLLSKGSSGEQVDLLIRRLTELGYLEEKNPTSFDSDVYEAVKWFQNTNLLDCDGIAGPKTLKCLYSASAMSADDSMKETVTEAPPEVDGEEIKVSIGDVQNIDFFSDEGQTYYDRREGVFKDGATAVVTDVASGISFRVRRTGGYYHADIEPVSAFDTWQMYRIYNYEWSWARHSVYVTLENGETLAGSINGMPHGEGEATANNYNGHLCLHFLNSRTHGSNKVDPDHQTAVNQAAGR